MKAIPNLSIYIWCLFVGVSCSQAQKKGYTQQDVLNLYKEVQHFEEEPHYGVRVQSANCNFEILINDRKVFATRKNEKGLVINGAYAPINYGILTSGTQQLTVRMLPPIKDEKTEIKHPTLGNAQLTIEIVADDFMDGQSTGEYPIFEWESPREVKYVKEARVEMPYFTHPDLPMYEHTATFKATVPYSIAGWSKSVNLYTEDAEELKALTEEAVAAYEELRQLFQNKQLDKLADLVYNNEKLIAQQLYFREQDSKEQWDIYSEDYQHKDFTMMPLKNFKLVFYGEGKMIALEHIGPKYQRASALWSRYIKEGKDFYSMTFYKFLLHRPKAGAKLEFI